MAHDGLTFLPKLKQMQDCFTALETCPVPVVAAVSGHCIGAGVDLVCCADVRVCSPNAVFAVREVALGLAADVGTLQRLPKIVGHQSVVRELCLTGRNFSAPEAAAMGFVSHVVYDDAHKNNNNRNNELLLSRALQLCQNMAQHSPVAVQGTKKALLYARDHSVDEGLDQIAAYNALALQGNDVKVAWTMTARGGGANATMNKPRFGGIPAHSKL